MSWQNLAWKTTPAVMQGENETIEWLNGRLEIPRKGYLDATELQWIREVDPANEQVQVLYRKSVELAQVIDDEKWSSVRCYGLLACFWGRANGGSWMPTEDEAAVLVKHHDILTECMDKLRQTSNILRTRTITVILRRNTPNWTDEMTMELPGVLQDKIYDFANEESVAGMGEQDMQKAQDKLEEDLKKLQEASRSILTDQTTATCIGNASDYGRATKSLAAKTTGHSQGNTSSRRLKRGTKTTAPGFMSKN